MNLFKTLYSVVHSLALAARVSIQPSFIGNLESMNAYHAKKDIRPFSPQLGLEHINLITECFNTLTNFSDVKVPDHVLKEVEGLIALFLSLKECQSFTQFSSIIFLYVRAHCDTSLSSKIIAYLTEVLQDLDFVPHTPEVHQPQWLILMRDVQQNWSLVKGNKAFKQLSKLLGVLVMLGLCDAADLTFDVAGFKLFDSKLFETHMSAFDIVDALLGTVTFFAEGVYKCFQKGSIRPLLINDQAALELDEEYALLVSWWDLVKCGNLERVLGITDQEFDQRIRHLNTNLSNLVSTLKGIDRKIVNDKLMKILTIKNDLVTFKISSGLRKSPFAVEIFGKSNQGKTTFGDQLLDALLTSAGQPVGKEYRAVINSSDKFKSTWTSDKLVAIVDDMAQDKSPFVEKAPTRIIIDMCNNQMAYAEKAELEMKSKCFMAPALFLVNSNIKHLEARTYTNCPYAIQRRLVLVFTVNCKPEFQLRDRTGRPKGVDSAKVRQFYTVDGVYTPQAIEDIWYITVEQAVEPESLTMTADYEVLEWRGKAMKDVSASEAIACACEYYADHRVNQDAIMQSMEARSALMHKCPIEGCVHIHGHCPDHLDVELPNSTSGSSVDEEDNSDEEDGDYDEEFHDSVSELFAPHFGIQTALAVASLGRRIKNRAYDESESFLDKLDSVTTKVLYKQADLFMNRWDWLCLIPSAYIKKPLFVSFALWHYADVIDRNHRRFLYSLWTCALLAIWAFPMFSPLIFLFVLYQHVFALSTIKKNFVDELISRNDCLPEVIKKTRDNYAKVICQASAGIMALYCIARAYRAWRNLQPAQGSLEPKTPEDVAKRDSEVNVWSTVVQRVLPCTEKVKTSTWEQLSTLVEKNLVYGTIEAGDKTLMCNLLFVKSNAVLIPNHYFEGRDSLSVTCRKRNADAIGGCFTTMLCRVSSVHIPETDMRLCYSSVGGSFKDITEYFPTGNPGDTPFQMNWRQKNGDMIHALGRSKEKLTSNTVATFMGGEYANLSINTFGGLCGGVLVSQTNNPMILGLHVGGTAGTPRGCFCLVTQDQLNAAYTDVRQVDGVLLTGNIEKFTPQILGVDILTGKDLHPKSPLNYLPMGSQISYHGSCPGAVTSHSSVRTTPISPLVEKILGVKNVWGPPKMRPEWLGWQTCLASASEPGTPFPHDLLAHAVKDYKEPLIELIKTDMWKDIRPLTDHENLCGVPGKKFLDAINLNTSIGYPLTGPKRKFVTELPPTKERPNNRVLDPVIMEEINRVEDMYARGFRAFTVAKACKKDEVLPVAKEKVRIFFGNSLSFVWLLRKYTLPLVRFLQMNPLLSECAVGINCHGPEWEEFYKFCTEHGLSSIFGGDYRQYDQKLTAQLIIAALRILIDLAREVNYDESELLIMEAMVADLVYALVAFNGDLVSMLAGMHISGNSLTVIVNGIGGSLNLRVFFFSIYSKLIKFRKAANMATYGDDNIGSVSPEYPRFNIKEFSAFLAQYGQTYTMPDKTAELQLYLDEGDFEFLKRESVYHHRLGVHVGALSKDSIYKSLHCFLRPKGSPLTPNQAAAQNLDTGLREMFNHGRDDYEHHRILFRQIAEEAGIAHMCTLLDDTYEDRVDAWYMKYKNASNEEPNPDYAFV